MLLANGGIAPGPHHIHPAHVILNTLRILAAIFVSSFVGFSGAVSGLASTDLNAGVIVIILVGGGGLFLLIILLAVVLSFLSYRRFLWEITESDIHIYSGIIFKKQVHIPFARVQSIDFNANVLYRILGLVKLKVETAGGASNKGVVIPALKLGVAEALRTEVFARKRGSEQRQEAALRQKMEAAKTAMGKTPVKVQAELGAEAGATAGVATGEAAGAEVGLPRFDPQTGEPLPGAFAPAGGKSSDTSRADVLIRDVGDEVGGLRGIFAEEYREDTPVEYEYGLKAKELLLAALSGDRNLVVFLVLVGALAQVWQFIESIGFGNKVIDAVANAVINQAAPTIIATLAITLAVVFVVSLLLGVLGTALSYGAFKARRRGGRIEVERGLLSRQYKGVSISRIQAIELRQGFIRRLIGYAELKLLTIDSMDTSGNQQNTQALQENGLVIHPFVKMGRAPEILAGLLPEFNDRPAEHEMRPLPKVSFRRSLIRGGIIPTLIYARAGGGVTAFFALTGLVPEYIARPILLALWALIALLAVLHLVGSVLWYRHAAYTYNPGMLTIRQGSYGMVTTVVPRRKVQWAATRQNPLQRLSGVATVSATTAAGTGGTTLTLRDIAADEATAYLDWLRPNKRLS
jgi:putative membrane protein